MTPPASDEALAWVHRGWDHLRRQRPLAAWASWNRALRIEPDQPAATEALAILAGAEDLPASARTVYRFRPPIGDDRRARWDAHFRGRDLAELEPAAAAFAELADADPDDSAARYNQALAFAWLGRNVEAIDALELVVATDAPRDFEVAVHAWMLAEILRQGAGAEVLADDLDHALVLPISEGVDPVEPLAAFAELRGVPTPPDSGARAFEWLDRPMPDATQSFSAATLPRVLAAVVSIPRSLRFSNPDAENLFKIEAILARNEFEPLAAVGALRRTRPLPMPLMDAEVWTFRVPAGLDEETRWGLAREAVELFYEDTWIRRGRRGLAPPSGSISPRLAARAAAKGDLVAKAKLVAVVRVREQLAARPRVAELYGGYPFDRLRRRLGLDLAISAAIEADDVTCMSSDELRRLDPAKLDDSRLVEACASASALGLPETFARLADALTARDAAKAAGLMGPWLEGLAGIPPEDEAEPR